MIEMRPLPPLPDMHVSSDGPDRLLITHDRVGLARVLAGLGVLLVAAAVWRYVTVGPGAEQFGGSVGGAVTCLLLALLFWERSKFVVDRRVGSIEWQRQRAWVVRHGRLEFKDVGAVTTERPLGDDGTTRRVVLHTRNGKIVPFTAGYLPDNHDVMLGLVVKLRLMLGHAVEEESLESLITRGNVSSAHTFQAIKEARATHGVSLTEAHARVRHSRPMTPR